MGGSELKVPFVLSLLFLFHRIVNEINHVPKISESFDPKT